MRYSVFVALFVCTAIPLAIVEHYLVSSGSIGDQGFEVCVGPREASMCSTYGKFNCSVYEEFTLFFGFGKYIVKLRLSAPINVSIAYVDSRSHECRIIRAPTARGEYVYALNVESDVSIVLHFIVGKGFDRHACVALIEVKRVGAPDSG